MSATRRIETMVQKGTTNPIAREVIDPDGLRKAMRLFPIVPYAGTNQNSAHSWLSFFAALAQQSPTHGAAINKKSTYAFGSPVLVLGEENYGTNDQLAQRIARYSFRSTSGDGLTNFARDANKQIESVGFCTVKVRVATVEGAAACRMEVLPTGWGLRIDDQKTGYRGFIISPDFTDGYLKRNPPTLLPEFPELAEADSAYECCFMISAGGAANYGRPPAIAAMMDAYEQTINTAFRAMNAANAFTPKVVFEVEGGDPTIESLEEVEGVPKKSFAEKFVENYTNSGENPLGVMMIERPIGASAMTVVQIAPQAGHDYFVKINEINDQNILAAHGCTLRFMGRDVAGGFSKETNLWDYVVNMEPVIDADRKRLTDALNGLFSRLEVLFPALSGGDGYVSFREPIYDAVQELKKGNSNGNTATL